MAAKKSLFLVSKKISGPSVLYTVQRNENGKKFRTWPQAITAAPDGVWAGFSDSVGFARPGGEWAFFTVPQRECPGKEIGALRADGAFLWVRRASTGNLCRLDTKTRKWFPATSPLIGQGQFFIPVASGLLVTSYGDPDIQGIALFDPSGSQRLKHHKTKRVFSVLPEPLTFIAGVDQGLVEIDRSTGAQAYTLPWLYNGGPIIRDIAKSGDTLLLATVGGYSGRLGDKMLIANGLTRIFVNKTKKWHTYRWEERERFEQDITSGDLPYTVDHRPGGISIRKNNKWSSLKPWGKKAKSNDVFRFARVGDTFFFLGAGGLGALDPASLSLLGIRKSANPKPGLCFDLTVSTGLLWLACSDGVRSVKPDQILIKGSEKKAKQSQSSPEKSSPPQKSQKKKTK